MKNLLRLSGAAAAAVLCSVLAPSCVYDPYYYGPGSTSVGAVYSSGFGTGVNTSLFVSTGDPRWGYDPYCQSYFDYHRRCYYDPFLHGYYPVGFRPTALVGCPHPVGWRPGVYCPPPRVINNVTVVNYRNRETAYRSSNYDWARQVRTRPVNQRPEESRPAIGSRTRPRTEDSYRPSGRTPSTRNSSNRTQESRGYRPQTMNRSDTSRNNNQRTRNHPPSDPRQMTVNHRQVSGGRSSANRQDNVQAQRPQSRPEPRRESRNESRSSREEESRPLRGLGQGRSR